MGASLETEVTGEAEDKEDDSVASVDCALADDASRLAVSSGFLNDEVCEDSEALRLDASLGLRVETASEISCVKSVDISTVRSSSPLFRPLILIFLIDLITGESLPL